MQDKIAKHVAGLPRSGIRDFFEVVQSMDDVISLGVGEPDFAAPWHIREAAIYSLERGRTSYTSNLGLPKLRKAISGYVRQTFGAEYDPASEILVTVGVSEALDLALRALIDPGDEVIYHEPCYVSYMPGIRLAHGVPKPVATRPEEGFTLRARDVAKVITPKSKILILNFPTNPTGGVLDWQELDKIAGLCKKHDLICLTDEIYSELIYAPYRHRSIVSLPEMRERTIFLHGFSKAYAMTGFRIGYACAPAPLTEALMKIHQYSMLCASMVSQDAALEALEHGATGVENMRRDYEARRNFIVKRFNEIGLPCQNPAGAFYVFPSIAETGLTSREFSLRLLEEHGVAVVPGSAFGESGEGFIRCSYATSFDQIKTALQLIDRFVQTLGSPAVTVQREMARS